MPTSPRVSRQPWLLGLLAVLGVLFLLFGFGSTPASGNLVAPPWDKVVHLVVFATLAIGLQLVLPTFPTATIAGLALTIGIADELHQYFVPTRQPELDDWLADAFGIFCGVYLWQKVGLRYFLIPRTRA